MLAEEQKQKSPANPDAPTAGVYPSFGPAGAVHYGSAGRPSTHPATPVQRQQSDGSTFSYLQGVPFKLSPEIRVDGVVSTSADRADVWRIEVDQILANMTRAVDLCSQ